MEVVENGLEIARLGSHLSVAFIISVLWYLFHVIEKKQRSEERKTDEEKWNKVFHQYVEERREERKTLRETITAMQSLAASIKEHTIKLDSIERIINAINQKV
ncbi:hypothetical protein Ctha_0276 [Chloroherpeton thalassium ATCC 35110]|uniref:Uncharacterized protein n=1 Tax=Chloroherpeton thalassium (strain ATCC 35110 / GB-78) TaxID=517418 RepID=B3QTK1_CHLT3|nr:hypothetical protein [Chloroherpeton thalassium]ACF12747.1 hypothetical protein Ctha_0276 [Chloroherpeton thalassium ATCC 35110]